MPSWSLPVTGLVLLLLFGLFYWLSIFALPRAVLAFTGTILIGFTGWAGHAIGTATLWIAHMANSLTGWAFAAPVGGTILTVIAGVIFVHDLWPKRGARKRTGWAGVALALLMLAGVTGIPALNGVVPGIRTGVTSVRTIGNGG
jgi:hypothetical protein